MPGRRHIPAALGADEQARFEECARRLAQADDPHALQERILSEFLRLSGAPSAWFFDYRPLDACYRRTEDQEGGSACQFDGLGPLARWLRVNDEPLVIPSQPAVFNYLPAVERNALTACSAIVCVPLVATHRLLAFVVLASGAGKWRPEASVVPLLGRCGRHAATVAEGVSRQHAERERLRAASRSQQLAVAGQVAAAVAHEVRNPLTTIRSSVQYVIDSPAEWRNKADMLRVVIAEVDRINRAVSGVLGLSRPHEAALVDLDAAQVAEDAVAAMRPYLDHHRLVLDWQGGTRPLPVRGEADQLRQVFLNVLLNACQATPDGGCIAVSWNVVSNDSGSLAAITICDTGCGMAPEQLKQAFEPFFTTRMNGTGLGLPICQGIMSRHGGSIRLQSEVGHGTTTVLTLPLRSM
jgi:signal transduction histidine kinase